MKIPYKIMCYLNTHGPIELGLTLMALVDKIS